MAKTNKTPKAEDNAELRTISLLKILNTYSDENHELSTKNIMDKLQKECGVTVHRNAAFLLELIHNVFCRKLVVFVAVCVQNFQKRDRPQLGVVLRLRCLIRLCHKAALLCARSAFIIADEPPPHKPGNRQVSLFRSLRLRDKLCHRFAVRRHKRKILLIFRRVPCNVRHVYPSLFR